jgi:hypothetical protein
MRVSRLTVIAALVAGGLLVTPLSAAAQDGDRDRVAEATETFDYTDNLRPIGFSARPVPLDNFRPRSGNFNSDLAFWGDTAVQGTYGGFRLIDVSDPRDPEEIVDWEDCASPTNTVGNQGDVIAWGERGSERPSLIIRSWNSPTPAPRENFNNPGSPEIPEGNPLRLTQPGAFCGDWPMFRVAGTPTHPVPPAQPGQPQPTDRGQEGVHVIDVSDPEEPEVVAFVDLPCGSHTETLMPDVRNGRLLVYSNPSSGTVFGGTTPGSEPVHCRGFDVVEVPLDAPEDASRLRFESTGMPEDDPAMLHPCHDTSVILGRVDLVACAGGSGPTVWSTKRRDGGSKEDPAFLYHKDLGTQIGHSTSFSWDGEVLIFGHEPGGGSQARCQATSSELDRTLFFLDAEDGDVEARFIHPRPQTDVENCTWHNFNVVPTLRRDVMVSGNYQSGISVVDFTDEDDPEEIAYADPAPLVDPNPPVGIELGGDWSSYWYDGEIYESDILRGLLIWRLRDQAVRGAIELGRLNPQTQETDREGLRRLRDGGRGRN